MFLKTLYSWASLSLLLLSLFACKEPLDAIRMNPDRDFKYKKAFEFYEQKDWVKAQALLEDLIPLYRLEEEAEKIYFAYAYTHFHQRSYAIASHYFKRFHTLYPMSEKSEEGLYMSARSSFELSPDYKLTQEDTQNAINGFQLFVNSYPSSEYVSDCNAKIDVLRIKLEKKALKNADGYFRRRQYRSAVHCYKQILEQYADTDKDEYLRFMIFKASYLYAQRSIIGKQGERYQEALAYYKFYNKRYGSDQAAQTSGEEKAKRTKEAKRLYSLTKQHLKELGYE